MRQWHLLVSRRRPVEMKPREIRNIWFCVLFKWRNEFYVSEFCGFLEGRWNTSAVFVHPLGLFSSPEGSGKEMDGKEKTKDRTECVWVLMYLVLVLLSAWDTPVKTEAGIDTPFVRSFAPRLTLRFLGGVEMIPHKGEVWLLRCHRGVSQAGQNKNKHKKCRNCLVFFPRVKI